MKKLASSIVLGSITFFSFFQKNAWSDSSLLLDLPPILASKRTTAGASYAVLNDNVFVIDSKYLPDIVETNIGLSEETEETEFKLSGELASLVNEAGLINDKPILYIPPSIDNRFPFGFSGEVANTTINNDETKTIVLHNASYAETFKESYLDDNNVDNISLDKATFIGAITPSSVESQFSGLEAGKISFNIKLDLKKMKPIENSIVAISPGEAVITVDGALEKIKIIQKHDFSFAYGLKSLDLRVVGDLNFNVQLTGKGSVKFGFYEDVWKEVKEKAFNRFGVNAKLTGLSDIDKRGKFPLAGLVWSVPCPTGCPVIAGTTRLAVNQAKSLGVIVWLYLTASGEISLDGTLGARLNRSNISFGIAKENDADLQLVNSMMPIESTARFIEIPIIKGILQAQRQFGLSAEADFFAFGIRYANAGLDIIGREKITITGINVSYGTKGWGEPWSWNIPNFCPTGTIGAGLIARASIGLGLNIATSWKPLSLNVGHIYGEQIPKEEEMVIPGWHGLWYTQISEPHEVTSKTGRVWMNQNLGACRVALSPEDNLAYGDLYQWGRLTDGHEKRNSNITNTLSSGDTPGHGNFITAWSADSFDWRDPQNNDLWQGVNGINNPCPDGFRLPTSVELQQEVNSWSYKSAAGAFASPLRLTTGGQRSSSIVLSGVNGLYWSSTTDGVHANCLHFHDTNGSLAKEAIIYKIPREFGMSVRCIKD